MCIRHDDNDIFDNINIYFMLSGGYRKISFFLLGSVDYKSIISLFITVNSVITVKY